MEPSGGKADSSLSRSRNAAATGNVLERLFALFFEPTDPERQKRRQLKLIARDLSRLKQRYYNPRGGMVLPDFPRFIHEIYKLLGPAQNLFKRAESSKALRSIVFEISLSDTQREVLDRLQDEAIRERYEKKNSEAIAEEIGDTLSHFSSSFTPEITKEINANFNELSLFLDFIHFDYYFFLKKFSSKIAEHDFSSKPPFESLTGEYVVDELKDFNDLVAGLNDHSNWDVIFDSLREYRKVAVIRRNLCEKAFRKLLDLRNAGLLELIIKHITHDPDYRSRPVVYNDRIVEPYLTALKAKTANALVEISKETDHRKTEELVKSVFGVIDVSGLQNYSEQANVTFTQYGMPGFVHAKTMNYVGAFLEHYFKGNLSQLVDLLLIKGKWVSKIHSQQISDSYHQLIRICDAISDFDLSLGEEEELGLNLRNLIFRAESDMKLLPQIRRKLRDVNDQAKEYIVETAKHLIGFAKCLKQVHADYESYPHQIIVNWGEIDPGSDNRIKSMMVEVYNTIYKFIQIVQHFHKR
jgi:hypothetical protein